MDKKKKVLIVEDDAVLAKALTLSLQDEGYELFSAADGEDAERLILQEVPDLVLLDLLLPIKNGFEVLKVIRQDSKTKDVPVVILTNYEEDKSTDEGRKLGVKEYIVKAKMPISEIPKIVKKYLYA